MITGYGRLSVSLSVLTSERMAENVRLLAAQRGWRTSDVFREAIRKYLALGLVAETRETKTVSMSFNLDEATDAALRERAEHLGVSVATVVRSCSAYIIRRG